MRAALILALLAAPAGAQAQEGEPVYDASLLEQCYHDSTDPTRSDCIGLASGDCIASAGGETTIGMSYCLSEEFAQWDAILNANYKAAMAAAEAGDKEMADLGSSVIPAPPLLRDAQRAWITFRDTACSYEGALWHGGTGGGPAGVGCSMELTARQAIWLMGRGPEPE